MITVQGINQDGSKLTHPNDVFDTSALRLLDPSNHPANDNYGRCIVASREPDPDGHGGNSVKIWWDGLDSRKAKDVLKSLIESVTTAPESDSEEDTEVQFWLINKDCTFAFEPSKYWDGYALINGSQYSWVNLEDFDLTADDLEKLNDMAMNPVTI